MTRIWVFVLLNFLLAQTPAHAQWGWLLLGAALGNSSQSKDEPQFGIYQPPVRDDDVPAPFQEKLQKVVDLKIGA